MYIKKNEILEAVKIFKKAILINPQYPDSYNNLGKCYIDLEKLSLAYLNFKKSYKINPNSDLPLINIANIISTSFFSVFLVISHAQIKKQSNVSAAGSSCFDFAISCDLYGVFDLSLFPWDLDQFP